MIGDIRFWFLFFELKYIININFFFYTPLKTNFFIITKINKLILNRLFHGRHKFLIYCILLLILYSNINIYEYSVDLFFLTEYLIFFNIVHHILHGKNGIRTHAQFIKTE